MRDLPAVSMEWQHGLFAHWPVAPERVRPLVPDALDVDAREGTAWVSALPSVVDAGRPALFPASAGLSFPQVNFRTYVRHGDRPGVYFLSLDAPTSLGVRLARALYGLPYYHADVDFESVGGETGQLARSGSELTGRNWTERTDWNGGENSEPTGDGDGLAYGTTAGDALAGEDETGIGGEPTRRGTTYRFEAVRWHTEDPPARFAATYRPTDRTATADPDSLDAFLAERYRAFVVRDGTVWCARVEHDPWPLSPADATVHADSLFEAADLPAPAEDPLVRYSPGVEMTVRTPFRP